MLQFDALLRGTIPVMDDERPRVGVSACLIGWEVRYAGGHKWNAAVAERVGRSVEWIPVCPELEIGLGVPREPIELEGSPDDPELVAVESRRNLTVTMREFAAARLEELDRLELSGYVLKARSPSCGPRDVPVFRDGKLIATGTGLFARALLEKFPGLPISDESELMEPGAVERFLAAVVDYRRNCRRR